MRVLILGGTRFIGPPLAHRLVEAGHDVAVFHRGETEAGLPSAVRHVHGERARLAEYAGEFRGLLPDVVVDMFAYSEADAQATMAAFLGVARRLIVLSSQDVYRAYGRFHGSEPGLPDLNAAAEDSPLRERLYPYRGRGTGLDEYEKILVERAATAVPDLPATILRLPMVYGERDPQRRLAIELRRMDDGRPAILLEETFARWRWTRTPAENAAAAIALAVADARAAGRVYNVGEPEALTYADWLREVGRAAGWQGEVVVVADGTLPDGLRPLKADYHQHLMADTSRIRVELGYVEPVARDVSLSRAVAWERAARASSPMQPIDYAAEDEALARVRAAAVAPAPPAEPPAAPPFLPS